LTQALCNLFISRRTRMNQWSQSVALIISVLKRAENSASLFWLELPVSERRTPLWIMLLLPTAVVALSACHRQAKEIAPEVRPVRTIIAARQERGSSGLVRRKTNRARRPFGNSSILLLKAAATPIHSSLPLLPPFSPHRSRYFSHALSNARGRLRLTIE
jgi:hypothetical protein